MTTPTPPRSLIEQAIWIVKELGIDADKPAPQQYGLLVTNLFMLKQAATHDLGLSELPSQWGALLDHLMYPDHNPFPQEMFVGSPDELKHYAKVIATIDALYNEFGE